MDNEEILKIQEFRHIHQGEMGARVLADMLNELGLFEFARDERQHHLKNHAIQVLTNMGVKSPGDRYQVLVALAKILQNFVPELEE